MGFWDSQRVFITGVTGLAGAHLAQNLDARGAKIVGLVRDRIPFDWFHASGLAQRVTQIEGSCEDPNLIGRTLNEYDITAVFHLAAQTQVTHAVTDPTGAFRANIEAAWTLLEACRHAPCVGGVLVASSDKAYGSHGGKPYVEGAAMNPTAPYDVSKACADMIARCYRTTYDLPTVVTRCANLFGEGDLAWHRLVPETCRARLTGRAPVIRSDGTPVRDYLYAGDAAEANRMLMEATIEGRAIEPAYNVSAGAALSVLEMVEKIDAALAKKTGQTFPPPVVEGRARHEIDQQRLDASAIERDLGWSASLSVEEALEKTADYYIDYFGAGAGL